MDSPALTTTMQDVPSGSWTQQCLAALSRSGTEGLQASDCGAGRQVLEAGAQGARRRALGGLHGPQEPAQASPGAARSSVSAGAPR